MTAASLPKFHFVDVDAEFIATKTKIVDATFPWLINSYFSKQENNKDSNFKGKIYYFKDSILLIWMPNLLPR